VGPASMHFYRALAEKKLSRFKQFAAIYPECCWVFCGDNGQVAAPPLPSRRLVAIRTPASVHMSSSARGGWGGGGGCLAGANMQICYLPPIK